jgi:integrase
MGVAPQVWLGVEILTLRWEDVDLERGALHLPDSKTGPKSAPANLGC